MSAAKPSATAPRVPAAPGLELLRSPRARICFLLGRALAALAWTLRIRLAVVLENLARAFPGESESARRLIARQTYRALGVSLGEMLLARGITDAQLEAWVSFEGFERYQQAAALGRGVVVAIGHFGNWELLGRACGRRGVKLSLIGRRLRGFWNRRLVAARVESGMAQLADRGSSAEALRRLRAGEVLAIAIDQNMREKRGVFVDFFGHPACTTPAAAVYGLRAGAPIIAAFPVRQPDGSHRVQVLGPFEAGGRRGHAAVLEVTQQLTRAIEALIRDHPEQWFWLHRRWKTRPSAGTRSAK